MPASLSTHDADGTELAAEFFSGADDGRAAASSAATMPGVLESAVSKYERGERSTEDLDKAVTPRSHAGNSQPIHI